MDDPGFWTRFAVVSLATWRLTHLLVEEDGPADVIVRLRARLGDSIFGRVLDCFYCLSVWVAAPMALLVCRDLRTRLVAWVALSGAACLLERATGNDGGRKAAGNELLWSEAPGPPERELTVEAAGAHERVAAGART